MSRKSENYHYITPEHTHRNGEVGRDLYITDRPATLQNDTSRDTGLPKAQDVGVKDHLVKERDY